MERKTKKKLMKGITIAFAVMMIFAMVAWTIAPLFY